MSTARGRSLILVLAACGVTACFLLLRSGSQAQEAAAPSEPLVILYAEAGFSGRSLEVRDTLYDLPVVVDTDGAVFNWNDEVRSIEVVSGTWRLYQHGRCNTELDERPLAEFVRRDQPSVSGWTNLVSATSRGALRVSSPERGGLHRDVSSIELVSSRNLPDWVYAP